MKPQFRIKLCALVLTFIVNGLHAQENDFKRLPDITLTAATSIIRNLSYVLEAAFADAENVRWSKVNKYYLAQFITVDIYNRVLFRRNGVILYHIRYGSEKDLPGEVRRLVRTNYDYVDLNITKAINVQENNRNIWIVNMEDDKKYIKVRVEKGQLEQVSSIKKVQF